MSVLDRNSPVLDSRNVDKAPGNVYECRVWFWPEEEGGYSAIVPSLPGVASQGETEREVLDNVREAFQGAVAEYRESGEKIPWRQDITREKPNATIEKWILVNV